MVANTKFLQKMVFIKFFKNGKKIIMKSALQRISRPNVLHPNAVDRKSNYVG